MLALSFFPDQPKILTLLRINCCYFIFSPCMCSRSIHDPSGTHLHKSDRTGESILENSMEAWLMWKKWILKTHEHVFLTLSRSPTLLDLWVQHDNKEFQVLTKIGIFSSTLVSIYFSIDLESSLTETWGFAPITSDHNKIKLFLNK